MKVVSFFAGAGGLDLGFEKAGFDVIWVAYKKNHQNTVLDIDVIKVQYPSDQPI